MTPRKLLGKSTFIISLLATLGTAANVTTYIIPAGGRMAQCGYYTLSYQLWASSPAAHLYVTDTVGNHNQLQLALHDELNATQIQDYFCNSRYHPYPLQAHCGLYAYFSRLLQACNQLTASPCQPSTTASLQSQTCLAKLQCSSQSSQRFDVPVCLVVANIDALEPLEVNLIVSGRAKMRPNLQCPIPHKCYRAMPYILFDVFHRG